MKGLTITVKPCNDDLSRITRCMNCQHSVVAPLEGEPPDTLYCPIHGYPCDMIIICEDRKIKENLLCPSGIILKK